ncbi:unnamed protein product [Mytilus edulis]|uniref:Reverse transcriptase domain-containing protein n=1 Tax=Mytilus edulis TaxID=6550 RepID=A0A8S3QA44_MYTED|nr:unnamed protein product [Mytilus edulis]
MRDIRLAATRSENWATYDEQFRLKIEKNPNLSWGNIHGEYWLLHITSPTGKRIGNDKAGKSTSKNLSVVDYALSTAHLLKFVKHFEVLEFSKLYSDIHSPLSLVLGEIRPECIHQNECDRNIPVRIKPWKFEKSLDFKNNIDLSRVEAVLENLDILNTNTTDIQKDSVNQVVQEISNILLESAKNSLGLTCGKQNSENSKKQPNKLWFNSDCYKARKELRRAKRLYKHYGSNVFKHRVKISEMYYKNIMDENIIKFNRDMLQYSSVDEAACLINRHKTFARLSQCDVKAAFRLLPIAPHDFDLLGIKFQGEYYLNKMLPMGASISCALWEKFAKALHWIIQLKSGNDDILHYLDDFLFVESSQTSKVGNTLKLFQEVCNKIGIPLASDKTTLPTTLPTTLLMFLGIEFDTQNLIMRLPNEKLVKLSQKIRDTLDSSKITLKDMQSLLGLLNFACKVVAPGRTFCRRLINSTIGVRKSYFKIRVNKQMKADLEVWLDFLKQYNGVTVITDNVWGLSGGTISSYISGVSYHHKIQGIQDTTKFFIIGKALEGIKRIQGGKRNDIRAPITVQLLSDMISCLDKVCKNKYEAALFSAVFSVAFFGLLRVGEITTSKSKSVINGSNLTISDILVRRKVLVLRVRWSKTDQKVKSVTLLIAENGKNYCPVRLINEYLKVRPTCNNTDLFIHYTGMPLTRYQFSSILEKALHFLRISKGHFRSHSFRIGGATELARQGVSEEVIMRLGRWKSHAYSRYIRLQFF